MKKYIFLVGLIGYSYCAPETVNIKMQILLWQLQSASQKLLDQVQKLVLKPASTGSLLGDIAQGGIQLKKTPKPDEKPKPVQKGGIGNALGNSDLLKKAQDALRAQAPDLAGGASEEEWEAAEKVRPSAPAMPKKTVEQPQLTKNLLGSNLPELKFDVKGMGKNVSDAIANYLTLLDLYLDYKIKNKSDISTKSKDRIKQDEESVDAIPEEKYSKTQKLQFHAKIQQLRNTYASLKLLPYAPKPLTPKPTTPAQPISQPIKGPVSITAGDPQKIFTRINPASGNLFGQIAGVGQSQLKPAVKASAEVAALNFNKMADEKIVQAVEKYKNNINEFSLKQLLDIAEDKEVFDRLDPDIVDDLKEAAKSKKGEADPGQLSALKFRYGIV